MALFAAPQTYENGLSCKDGVQATVSRGAPEEVHNSHSARLSPRHGADSTRSTLEQICYIRHGARFKKTTTQLDLLAFGQAPHT
jgi:hypothetical protein